MSEIRDDEITIDKFKVDSVKTTRTRYYTLSLGTALLILGFICIAAWGGVFFLGFSFGATLCGG